MRRATRKYLVMLLLIFAAGNLFSQTKHVILISIDGLRPEFYLDARWPAPNLQQLMKSGTYAEGMRSVFPSYTYPTHTAMLTGAFPARSGIFYNQPRTGNGVDWHWFLHAVKVPTLWQSMKALGMSTAAVEWPVSVTKDITWNIPEIWSDENPDRITESRKYATPGLIEEIEVNATGKLDKHNMAEEAFSMDDNSARMAAYIFKVKKPSLLAVHFAGADGMQHQYGRDHDSVRLAVAAVDRAIGHILETVKHSSMEKATTVLIVGDHGFSTYTQVMRPNILIKGIDASFKSAGGSCFLYGKAGTEKQVVDILNRLPKETRGLFRIIGRKELHKMGADSAALLALSAKPGMVFSGSVAAAPKVKHGPGTSIQQDPHEGLFIKAFGGHHGYDPEEQEMWTGFIASGTGIRSGGKISSLRAIDIAPLIAKLLGIEFKVPDGKLVSGIMK